jgi:hypothetical protein
VPLSVIGISPAFAYPVFVMVTQELFAQAIRLQPEERRFLAEMIWETVNADLPAQWSDDSTIVAEVERRYEANKSGQERSLTA